MLAGQITSISESKVIHRFGVSNATARRVLNEIQEEGLLRRIVGKGSVVVNQSERVIKEFGIVFFDIFNRKEPFVGKIGEGIEEMAREQGNHIHFYTTRQREIAKDRHTSLYYLVTRRKINGFFVLSPLPAADIEFFLKEGMSFVVLENDYPGLEVATVMPDFERALLTACERLVKMGQTRIGLVTGAKNKDGILTSNRDFLLAAYRKSLAKYHLPYDERLVVESGYTEEDGHRAIKKLSAEAPGCRPETVITSPFSAYRGVKEFLADKPDWQPLVIPFADHEIDEQCYFLISYKEMGREAFRVLTAGLGAAVPYAKKTLIPMQFITHNL